MFTSARRIFWMLFQVSTALTSNVTSATSLKIIGQLRADYWRKNLNFSRNKLYTFVLTYPPNLNTVGRTQQQISPKTYCPQRTYPPAYVLSLEEVSFICTYLATGLNWNHTTFTNVIFLIYCTIYQKIKYTFEKVSTPLREDRILRTYLKSM